MSSPPRTQDHTAARAWAYLRTHRIRVAVLFFCILLPLLGFGLIAEDIVDRDAFAWDESVLFWMRANSSPALDPFVLFVTQLGGPIVMTVATLAVAAALFSHRPRSRGLYFLLVMGGELLLNQLAKLAFARPRPDLWAQLVDERAFSFPSGHAMASSAYATALVLLFWYTPWRVALLIGGVLFVLAVCLSRLYLGVHYPTDVLAGSLASLAWAVGLWQLFRRRTKNPEDLERPMAG